MSRSRKGGQKRAGERFPSGKLKPRGKGSSDRAIAPTPEFLARRKGCGISETSTDAGTSMDYPLDVMEARSDLLRRDAKGDMEDRGIGKQRRDAGAYFARLAWHTFGHPFASIDQRTKRLIPPSTETGPDGPDPRRAALSDFRDPLERAEDVRCRYEAMRSLLQPGSVKEWVVRQVAVYCRPINTLARAASKREQYRLHLIDALDSLGDMRAVMRAEKAVRATWEGKAAA